MLKALNIVITRRFLVCPPVAKKQQGPRCQKATFVFKIDLLDSIKELTLDFFVVQNIGSKKSFSIPHE